MPHQKNPVESLREEWIKALKDESMFNKDVYNETADWWIEKLSTHHDQLLVEMLEEVGEDIPNTVQNSTGNYVKIIPTQKDLITNEERSRIRSLLLAKKRKDL